MKKNIIFRDYNQKQMVLPSSIMTLIPENHIVRVVNDIIDSIDISALIEKYQGGGISAYNPKMLLKVLVYAYTQKVYSGKNIAKQFKENIYYMWIAGHEKPDFRRINRFRSEKLGDEIDNVFSNILMLLIEKEYGIKDLEEYEGKEITSKDLSENINKHFNDDKNLDKKLKKKKKILDDDYSSKAKKYEEYI